MLRNLGFVISGLLAFIAVFSTIPCFGQSRLLEELSEDEWLEPSAIEIDQFGLRFCPPLGASAMLNQEGGALSVVVTDGNPQPKWTMQIQRLNAPRTPKEQVELFIRRLREAGQQPQIFANNAVQYANRTGQLCYLKYVLENQFHFRGWLFLPSGDEQLTAFSILIADEQLLHTLATRFHASFSTIELIDQEQLAEIWHRRQQTAKAFLASLDEEALRKAIGHKQWLRHYLPHDSGEPGLAQEVSFSYVEVTESPRGALAPERAPANYTSLEKELGLTVRVRARFVVSQQNDMYYDTVAMYWLAWDMSEEQWSIRTTMRGRYGEQTHSETGIRSRPATQVSHGELHIVNSTANTGTRKPLAWPVPDVYLSQALHWILGVILPQDSTERREFGYHYYVSAAEHPGIKQRTDRWQPDPSDPNYWILTSSTAADLTQMRSTFDSAGKLVHRTWPNGTTTEPVDPHELRQIWQQKQLSMGAEGR